MPTGYTADVADGKVTDFRTFALRCARAMGATIMQRDDRAEDEPKHREESPYYAEALALAELELTNLNAMTLTQAANWQAGELANAKAQRERYAANKRATKERYQAMLVRVTQWTPPTAEHDGLKAFMQEQLRSSIDFDCAEYPFEPQPRVSPDKWLEAKKERARDTVKRAAQSLAEERIRVTGANAWIDALYASLPSESPRRSPEPK